MLNNRKLLKESIQFLREKGYLVEKPHIKEYQIYHFYLQCEDFSRDKKREDKYFDPLKDQEKMKAFIGEEFTNEINDIIERAFASDPEHYWYFINNKGKICCNACTLYKGKENQIARQYEKKFMDIVDEFNKKHHKGMGYRDNINGKPYYLTLYFSIDLDDNGLDMDAVDNRSGWEIRNWGHSH